MTPAAYAQFWNTVTNLTMVVLGLYGAWRGVRLGLELRMIVCFLALALLGVGSAAFHGTLRFDAQLADEIPMLWTDAAFLYCVSPQAWRTTAPRRTALVTSLFLVVAFVSLVYVYTRNVMFFESSYGLGTLIITSRCALWARARRDDPKAAPARRLIFFGTCLYIFAFVLWTVDNTFCLELRRVRKIVGPFIAPLFQLHG